MRPGIFDVEALPSLTTVPNIWKGSDTESSLRKPASRRSRPQQQRGGRGSSSAAPASHAAADPPEEQPNESALPAVDDAADEDAELERLEAMINQMYGPGSGLEEADEDFDAGHMLDELSPGSPQQEAERDGQHELEEWLDDSSQDEGSLSEGVRAADGEGDAGDINAQPQEGLLHNMGLDFADVASGVTELHMSLGNVGELRFNLTESFFKACCPNPAHHGCHRRRTAKAAKDWAPNPWASGQGRPIGALVAWLREASNFSDRSSHMAAPAASFADRQEARTWFMRHAGASTFAGDHERPLRGGEGAEPRVIK